MKRRRLRLSLVAGVSALALGLASCTGTPSEPQLPTQSPTTEQRPTVMPKNTNQDPFGIRFIAPSMPNGLAWVSKWGTPRSFDGVDPHDPWFDADHGSATFETRSEELLISGRTPRMYIHDPENEKQWRDVEITMYFKRVDDSNVPYAGMTAVARANHGVTGSETEDLCDTRGYGARIRYDGYTDFEKETSHPDNESKGEKRIWKGGMPYNKWMGFKYLVYDVKGVPHLETWLDENANGKWRMINETIDDGQKWGEVPCAKGINQNMALTNSPNRVGSESGKPNLSVYFRSDGVDDHGLVYKHGSVREIKR